MPINWTITIFLLYHNQVLKCLSQFIQNFPGLAETRFIGAHYQLFRMISYFFPLSFYADYFVTLYFILFLVLFQSLWGHYGRHLYHLWKCISDHQLKVQKILTMEDMILMVQKKVSSRLSFRLISYWILRVTDWQRPCICVLKSCK